ncbi:MAG: chromate transporter [Lachnospiraceae bacterium]|nr:chromate transporter [Lachnospiraceae bacterium]
MKSMNTCDTKQKKRETAEKRVIAETGETAEKRVIAEKGETGEKRETAGKASLWELFITFAKVSLFTIGGGLAMIAMVERTCVEDKKWMSHDDMMDLIVISESTPGPIAINCATYAGQQQAGFAGALAATVGMVLPSLVIISLIALFLDNFLEITWVAHAFKGIKLAVGILILDAAVKMIKKMDHPAEKSKKRSRGSASDGFFQNLMPRVILIGAALAMLIINIFAIKFSTISLMLIAGVVSLVAYAIGVGSEKTRGGLAADRKKANNINEAQQSLTELPDDGWKGGAR